MHLKSIDQYLSQHSIAYLIDNFDRLVSIQLDVLNRIEQAGLNDNLHIL